MNPVFDVAVKSSLDKLLNDVAVANGWMYFDIDGAYLTPEIVESKAPAIVISYPGLTANPRDPFYAAVFEVGARTADDPFQYLSKNILGEISLALEVNKGLFIYDHSGSVSGAALLGELIPTSQTPSPSRFDQVSSLSMYQIVAMCQRFVSYG